jgi:hypothetical protein
MILFLILWMIGTFTALISLDVLRDIKIVYLRRKARKMQQAERIQFLMKHFGLHWQEPDLTFFTGDRD